MSDQPKPLSDEERRERVEQANRILSDRRHKIYAYLEWQLADAVIRLAAEVAELKPWALRGLDSGLDAEGLDKVALALYDRLGDHPR